MNGRGRAGFARPEYGDAVYDLACDTCGATWCGHDRDPCQWCAKSLQRLLDDQRAELLNPHWLAVDHGPRYDELGPDDRLVWDRTRGQGHGAGSRATWLARLCRAVETGLITETECKRAVGARRAA
jgi:hypothetical protein